MKKASDSRLAGFTLIELLVTVSIISILLTLTAVGVQAAREAGRRSKCASNLRQVALAVQMYHNAHNGLPALCTTYKRFDIVEKTDTGTEIGMCGAQIFLLPFLEQEQVYSAFEDSASLDSAERHDPPHICCRTALTELSDDPPIYIVKPSPPDCPKGTLPPHWAAGVVIPVFVCPSDGESGAVESPEREYPGSGSPFDFSVWSFSRRNVMFNMGDAPLYNCDIDTPATKRGAFTPHVWKSFSHITDGLSNTLCLAESITGGPTDYAASTNTTYPPKTGSPYSSVVSSVPPSSRGGDVRRDVVADPHARDPAGMRVWPGDCYRYVDPVDSLKIGNLESWGQRGTYWFVGKPLSNGFSANLPPNSLTCSFGYSPFGPAMGGVSSFHPGGANAAMMDGSVRFIRDDIDTGSLMLPWPRLLETNQAVEGKSTYGVWGAMGSINGGESAAL